MINRLNIAVADDELEMRDYFRETLMVLGHELVGAAENGTELVKLCQETSPDLVITDIKMPDMDGIEAARRITKSHAIPVILVSAYHDQELIERAEQTTILSYLVKPITQGSLSAAIAIADSRFRELNDLQKEAGDLKQALEDRKLIEKAKGILMKRLNVDEPEAFGRLRRAAMSENRRLVDVAKTIVLTEG